MKRSDPPRSQRWALYASHLGDYMKRWIFRTPWGTIRVHKIMKSDEGRDFHDHPFHFVSLMLRGGYREHVPGCICGTPQDEYEDGPCRVFKAPALVVRRATDFHRLDMLTGTTWTLVFSSTYFRTWGFLTPNGWVPYETYHRSFK